MSANPIGASEANLIAWDTQADWIARDFVLVHDLAVPTTLCAEAISSFEGSARRRPGVTGHGLDERKKRSTDINLTDCPEFNHLQRQIAECVVPFIEKYFLTYHFALVGALAPTVSTTQGLVVELNEANWVTVGRPLVPMLVRALYRLGPLNMQRYDKGMGGYPHWHSEIYPQKGSHEALHRALFVMVYLNDVLDGGETDFYYQNLSVAPKTGRLVIAPAGFTHTHRGRTPVSDAKYIVTSWILFRPL
jgi:hypothetical protein